MDIVARRDVVLLLDAIRDRGAAVLTNRVVSVTRRMFGFAIERGVIVASPFVGIRASREAVRARTLSDDEMIRLWAATAPESPKIERSTRMALRLLLLTGARASEVCGGRFDERLLRLPLSNELKLTFRLRRATMVKWLPRDSAHRVSDPGRAINYRLKRIWSAVPSKAAGPTRSKLTAAVGQ